MKTAVQQRKSNLGFLATSVLLLAGVFYLVLAGGMARAADTLDAQRILRDAWVQFERSASQDPITQQKIATCIGEKAIASGAFGNHSTYDPREWKSINTNGLDLRALSSSVNEAIRTCQNQSGARRYQ